MANKIMIYNSETLDLKGKSMIGWKLTVSFLVLLLITTLYFTYTESQTLNVKRGTPSYEEAIQVINEKDLNYFSPKILYKYMQDINLKHPKIVWTQALIESGFKSTLFKEQKNLFGMRIPKSRPTLSVKEVNSYSSYNSWKESVLDYAFYQTAYLRNIKTEKDYLEYLSNSYAEDSLYAKKIEYILNNFNTFLDKAELSWNKEQEILANQLYKEITEEHAPSN